MTGEERGDVGAPALQLGHAPGRRATLIGNIVDRPAEVIDGVHRLALVQRQNAHRHVKGTPPRHGASGFPHLGHGWNFRSAARRRMRTDPNPRMTPSPPTNAKPALPTCTL